MTESDELLLFDDEFFEDGEEIETDEYDAVDTFLADAFVECMKSPDDTYHMVSFIIPRCLSVEWICAEIVLLSLFLYIFLSFRGILIWFFLRSAYFFKICIIFLLYFLHKLIVY